LSALLRDSFPAARFQFRVDAEQELELDAAVLDVAQEGDVVWRVAKVDDGIGIRGADIVEQHGIVRGLGRTPWSKTISTPEFDSLMNLRTALACVPVKSLVA